MSGTAIQLGPDTPRLFVCVGTGGVGKTTCAAALARRAAAEGRNVAILTIDPSKRLADALGVPPDDDSPGPVPDDRPDESGSLHVYTLNPQRTFDRLVERFAPDPQTRERIFANRLYQQVVTSIAGSAEYAAMERIQEIAEDERHDLIVVDTPPASHTLDFLEAPGRLTGFLESRFVTLLIQPGLTFGRFGLRLFEGAARRALGLLESVSGLDFLEDLSDLLIAIQSLTEGLHGRALTLNELLRSSDCQFLLVTGPATELIRRGQRFLDDLEEAEIRVAGVIVNRVRQWPGDPRELDQVISAPEQARQQLESALGEDGAAAAFQLASGYASQVMLDRETLAPLAGRARREGWLFCELPELPGDVHDLSDLDTIGAHLVATT